MLARVKIITRVSKHEKLVAKAKVFKDFHNFFHHSFAEIEMLQREKEGENFKICTQLEWNESAKKEGKRERECELKGKETRFMWKLLSEHGEWVREREEEQVVIATKQ